eukprot:4410335-Alexandrium_andersonii.AAC.1
MHAVAGSVQQRDFLQRFINRKQGGKLPRYRKPGDTSALPFHLKRDAFETAPRALAQREVRRGRYAAAAAPELAAVVGPFLPSENTGNLEES